MGNQGVRYRWENIKLYGDYLDCILLPWDRGRFDDFVPPGCITAGTS